jgi:dihydropteroate synthase
VNARKPFVIPLPAKPVLQLGARTLIMGILNVTPDSFADGGLYLDPDRAVDAGLRMIEAGADIIDIGGESTRPGAEPLPAEDELARVLPVVERLAARTPVPLSIDTYKAIVAREAVARGAVMINDVSGLQYDAALGRVAAETGAALVLMHTRGRSRDMYGRAVYDDTVAAVVKELREAIARAEESGVAREAIVVDPGLGFAKRAEHSFDVLARLDVVAAIDRPILAGPSRKSFLKAAVGERPPQERDWATAAAVTASILAGAHIVRVHNVAAMVDVVRVADRVISSSSLG